MLSGRITEITSSVPTFSIRKRANLGTATGSLVGTVDEELADLLIFVCAIANRLDINLADALRRKEAFNETRAWA